MDHTQQISNLLEFVESLAAVMEDTATIAFLAEDLAGLFLQHEGQLPQPVIAKLFGIGKSLLQHGSKHPELVGPSLILMKNALQWIDRMGSS